MQKRLTKKWIECKGIIVATLTIFCLLSIDGIAAEDITDSSTEADENDTCLEITNEEVLSVVLPVVAEGEPSPFDFILDPCGLLYETNAIQYGGGIVEEGATMVFHNEEGGYDFSRYSDKLLVTKQSESSVIVTISASVSNLEEIYLSEYDDFSGNENPAIYLAITDSQGNEKSVSEDGTAQICTELNSDVYAFGLKGACNSSANWEGIYVHPQIIVTWHVESKLVSGEEIENPSNGDITVVDPNQEDLKEPLEEGAFSIEDKKDERIDLEASDSEAEVPENSSKEVGVPSQDTSDESENMDISEETTNIEADLEDNKGLSEENVDESYKAEKYIENSDVDSETDKEMCVTEDSALGNESINADE